MALSNEEQMIADMKAESHFTEACEEFYWVVRRRMTHGLITARFIREELLKVLPEVDDVQGADLVRFSWGDRCQKIEPECPACAAWALFDRNAASNSIDLEPTMAEVLQRMEEDNPK